MERNYPNLIDAYLKYTDGHESTERIRKWCVISIIAAALERKVSMNRGYYTLFPNLYVFIIGRSGLAKKSTSTGIAVNLLKEIQTVRIMSERLTAGSLIEQMKLAGKRYEKNGASQIQSALFAYASELTVFMEEVFGDITSLLTTFYDCQPNDCSKPWVYNTVGRGDTKIYGPCLNLLGASTKAWLNRCIPKSDMEGGFASRIIFVVENSLPEKLVPWPAMDDNIELDRLRILEDLRHIHGLIGDFKVSEQAYKLFSAWYQHHMTKVMPHNQDERMTGYLARKGDTILKLAMIRSVSMNDTLTLEVDDLVWANKELDALEPDWRCAFDDMADHRNSLEYDMIFFIKNKMIVKKDELIDHFKITRPICDVNKCIEVLTEMQEMETYVVGDVPYFVIPGYAQILRLKDEQLSKASVASFNPNSSGN